jgi:hypothetical protein
MRGFSGLLLGVALLLALVPAARAGDPQWTMQNNYALAVGQSATIYAVRAKSCEQGAPGFDEIKRNLPRTTLGTFSDGGTVQRASAACNKGVGDNRSSVWVSARAITFTAAARGTETLKFGTDPIVLTVK